MIAAQVGDRAPPAFRKPRLAGVATEQDQPVMCIPPKGLRHDFLKFCFDRLNRLPRRQARTI